MIKQPNSRNQTKIPVSQKVDQFTLANEMKQGRYVDSFQFLAVVEGYDEGVH